MASNSNLSDILDEYFKKLDRIEISSTTIFSSEDDKERYETQFMYAIRKYYAALYHYQNVKNFLGKEGADARAHARASIVARSAKFKSSRSADHYVYELSAFLEALKSSLDFIATACSPHLRGITMDSINTLIKAVTKNKKTGPIFDEVGENLDWIERLRSYRHHLVHRRIIRLTSGYEIQVKEGITKEIVYPVIIPESPPSYIPDTRQARFMENDEDPPFDISELTIRNGEGIINYSIEFHPPHGFVRIDEFMESHLISYQKFFKEILGRLSTLNFTAMVK